MHIITFEIGDWSTDGHGFSAEYLVRCNRSLEEMRELHLSRNDFIGSICSDAYEDCVGLGVLYPYLEEHRGAQWSRTELLALIQGSLTGKKSLFLKDASGAVISSPTIDDVANMDYALCISNADAMLHVWLLMLRALDVELEAKVLTHGLSRYEIKYRGYPYVSEGTMHYYGFDERGRHLEAPGYGVWAGHEREYYHGY